MKITPQQYIFAKKQLQDSIKKIPKKNKQKFFVDFLKLIEYAQKDNYENYNLPDR